MISFTKNILILLSSMLIVSSVMAESPKSRIVEYTHGQFSKHTQDDQSVTVLVVYTSWCTTCNALLGNVDKVAQTKAFENTHILKVNWHKAEYKRYFNKHYDIRKRGYVLMFKQNHLLIKCYYPAKKTIQAIMQQAHQQQPNMAAYKTNNKRCS